MDAIRGQFKNPLVLGLASFVAGLVIGLVVLGWWLWPVKYTGAGPQDLRLEEKAEYMRMAMEAYAQNQNVALAQARYQALGEEADEALQEIVLDPGLLPLDVIQNYSVAVGAVGPMPGATQGAIEGEPPLGAMTTPDAEGAVPGAVETEEPAGRSLASTLLPILCGVVLLALASGLVYFYMRSRTGKPAPRAYAPAGPQRGAESAPATYSDAAASQTNPPLTQFITSYKVGDDLFDDSFSVESPAGEFMGECGIVISETVGVGEPKKVTAFEMWLFDRLDIQTVTKVLMSNYAYEDDNTRQRLAAKGEPILLEPGAEIFLETQSLQMIAKVVDMEYGNGAAPDDSYFDRLVMELTIWSK